MALLNIFKKKKPGKKPKDEKSASLTDVPERHKEKETEERIAVSQKERKIVVGDAYRFLKTLHVTEKATDLTKLNQYIFEVYPKTNKTEAKKAVQDLFGVEVVSVKMINIPEKKRRLGRIEGKRPGCKKAIVKLKEGQKIEVLSR